MDNNSLSRDWRDSGFIREPQIGDILLIEGSRILKEVSGINSFGLFLHDYPNMHRDGYGHSFMKWKSLKNFDLFTLKEWKERTQ